MSMRSVLPGRFRGMDQHEDAGSPSSSHSASLNTGHRGVDEAMAAISALGDADPATHVTTFERAHDALRRALTSPTDVLSEEDASAIAEA